MPIPPNYVALAGSERTPMPSARAVADADPNERMQVTVYIRPKKPLALSAAAVNHDALPHQRRYLTQEEYRALHGASESDIAKVEEFARTQNLAVSDVNDAHRSVKLTGAAADFARAFGVEMRRYEYPGGAYRGRTGAIHIPASLEGVVEGVFGLDNRPAAEPHCGMGTVEAVMGAGAGGTAAAFAPLAGGTFTTPQVAGFYNFPANRNGAGQTIAIVELGGGINNADLAPYFTGLGLPQPAIVTVSVDSGQNNPNPGDANQTLEVMLDIEVAGAVAPGSRLAVYFAPNSAQSFINAVNTAVHDAQNSPSVISISWGQSEDSWTDGFRQQMDQAFQAAALLGITACCASGDNGSSDKVADGRSHADFPASSPNALGCGGTSVTAAGTAITSEVVWNNAPGQISGGGISDKFPPPAYQLSANLPPSANPGGGPGRGVPDVAGHAAWYQILFYGKTVSAWGTSAVAPLWAGLTALLNQTLGTRAGFLNPVLYRSPAALRDVVSGNNGAYAAGPAWDACTGLGSPNGTALVAILRPAPGLGRRGSRNFLQSNWGRQGNFELLVPHGSIIRQYFRNDDDPALAWHFLQNFGYPVRPTQLGPSPRAVTFLQSNYLGDGVHGNFEAIVRVAPPIATQPDHLDFWFLDSKTSNWNGPFALSADGQPMDGVSGDPVMIQGNWGTQGNFELLVPHGNMIRQYYRNNDDPALAWHFLRDFGYPVRPNELGPAPRGLTFIQSNFMGDGVHGNFEVIVRVSPPIATQPDRLDFWFLDSKTSNWNGPFPLSADGQPMDGVTGDPVLIQSDWGTQGNFELLVPHGNVIRQYFRNNDDPALAWHFLREFGYPAAPTQLGPAPRSIAFFQSNYLGDGVHGNFEAVVRVASPIATQPDHLDFWFLDSRTGQWNGPFALSADGQAIDGVTGD